MSDPAAQASGPPLALGVQTRPGLTPPRRRDLRGRSTADVITDLGFLPREQVVKAGERAKAAGRTLEHALTESQAVTSEQLSRAKAERFGLDHVDLSLFKPDLAAVNLITPQAARRYSAVPIGFDAHEVLLVAMTEPANILALDDLKLITRHELRPVVASPEDVQRLIGRMNRLDDAVAQAQADDADDDADALGDVRESADEAPIIKLVNSIIAQAVEDGASDIHFEPDGRDMRVRFRIDGILHATAEIPRRMVRGVISRVKIMAELNIAERRVPQDGRMGLRVEGRALDLRVVTMPSVHGEAIVMRILDKEQVLLTLDTLGMRDEGRRRFEAAFAQSYGAVLVTGPTGSGKSTTLYAALNALNSTEKKILTIEDPVEYQLPGITQVQVNHKAGLTFAGGLRAMLRADPDIIMVGEIRDTETARIAVESALTGHLVLSTLHTNDAASAITRLTEMGIAPFLTASALDCVVAQRLTRTLCASCRRPVVLTPEVLRAAGLPAEERLDAFEPGGCPRCNNTGYKGRTGLYEVMRVSEEIRALTVDRATADRIRGAAIDQGMRPLREDGIEKVRLGLTSLAEVARVA
jgi:type IV pilus assembly protein PilB